MTEHSVRPRRHAATGATRLEIVEHIFNASTSTTVHMKDRDSGPQGMQAFVNGVLTGLDRG